MEYFCYISESKVDQLLGQIEAGEIETWEVAKQQGGDKALKIEAALPFNIAKIATEFGRNDMFQTNMTYRRNLVQKLFKLLSEIKDQIVAFNWRIFNAEKLLFYSFEAQFSYKKDPADESISIFETFKDGKKLQLHCSSKYLSDNPNVSWSLNHALYTNDKTNLETVFLLAYQKGDVFVGSPLYLQHNYSDG